MDDRKVNISINLNEAQIKEAIVDWLLARGFDASTSFVSLFYTNGDRPGDIGFYSASASNVLIAQPIAQPARP